MEVINVAHGDLESVGATVCWRMCQEEDIDRDQLIAELAGVGMQLEPAKIGYGAALLRVLQRHYATSTCLVKPISSRRSASPRYAVMGSAEINSKKAFTTSWEVSVATDDANEPQLEFSDASSDIVEFVSINFGAALFTLGRLETSQYLTQVVKQVMHGVATVADGSYFIGPKELPMWRALKKVFGAHGVRLYEVPAMRCDQVVEWVTDSLAEHARKQTDAIRESLAEIRALQTAPNDKRVQINRRIATQQSKAQEQIELIKRYEEILGVGLDNLRHEISKLDFATDVNELATF